jgi:1-acyl-sn-glycerol-3-phosphate acyltransferase
MTESKVIEEEEKPRLDKKTLTESLLYFCIKGIGGSILKNFMDFKVEGEENIPLIGKAIVTTLAKNVFRDMLIISQLTGRKVHFMVHPKIMKHQLAGPLLKSVGMIRGTRDKEDTEPIDNVFRILNEVGDLIGLTPEAKLDREVQIKSMAGIIKFAVHGKAPIIPILIYTEKTKLFNLIPVPGLRVKVGNPIKVEKRLVREKYREERYELAEDIINIIESLRPEPKEEEPENEF